MTAAAEKPTDPLARYWAKRDFGITAEPRGEHIQDRQGALSYVIQKHAASRLHYDFRLELDGVLVSWAVPKGPSFDPADKRMAIHVEDHPLSYGSFEGTIPPKQYGAGEVIVWDRGTWEPVGDPRQGMAAGKLLFQLHGEKLQGLWELVKIAKGGEKQEPWILFKKRDAFARQKAEYDVLTALPDSVIRKPLRSQKENGRAAAAVSQAALGVPKEKARKRAGQGIHQPATPGASAQAAGAVKAPLPEKLSPQLATLAAGVPRAGEWLYEIKFDGYRLMARIENGKARLITRGGHDWSAKMPALIRELERLGLTSAFLDGEIVVLGPNGSPDFNALQNAFDRGRGAGYSADFEGDPASILASACRLGLEGLIAKRADAAYTSRRSDAWLKLKCKLRQEFVVAGYTERSDSAAQVGSLLLGVHAPDGSLVSAGSVGTGWDVPTARELMVKLAPLQIKTSPFAGGPAKPGRWSKRAAGAERWVEPRLVAEVSFAEWTPDGQIRHASYVGLRSDKPARRIVRETAKFVDGSPTAPAPGTKAKGKPPSGGIRVSNADRVIDAASGLTKLDLVRYYESVVDFILPHLKGRPVSLVRGPQGVGGQLFFQKHGEKIGIPGITELDASLWPGHASLLEVANDKALAGAAQLNVVEFHTWNSTKKAIDRPDRMIFDLDPGEGTSWAHIQEAAVLTHALLHELGLKAWLKTSGGKGLHVVVPLAPRLDYDTVNAFSKAIVTHLAKTIPSRFVAKSGAGNRVGKLFVDYLRNGHGATTAAAFSARARPGLGVSMPIAWDDLQQLKSGAQWTIATAREHLSFQKVDPWADYWKTKQSLSKPMRVLGFDR